MDKMESEVGPVVGWFDFVARRYLVDVEKNHVFP